MSDNQTIVQKLVEADKTDGTSHPQEFKWTFQRLGGVDQVVLRTAEDLRHLGELDPKLWSALSCPASGMEFDQRTLTLIDQDKDGRIRIPEVVEAVDWTTALLKDPADMIQCRDRLDLDAIDDSTPEGKRLHTTGLAILKNLGKPDAGFLTQEDVSRSAAHASEQTFNGDGILPPAPELGKDVAAYIQDAMAVIGGVEDAGGQNGVNLEISNAFIKTLADWRDWRSSVDQAATPVGERTQEAWELLVALKPKIDDYFLRCELAAYAPETRAALNLEEQQIVPSDQGLLDTHTLSGLPLSRIEADKPLELTSGINPVWRDRVERFANAVAPLLSQPDALTRDDWRGLQDRFAAYGQALAKKPAPVAVSTTYAPTGTPDRLGRERIDQILNSGVDKEFARLASMDASVPAAAADIAEVERLVLYHKHLYRLLRNFVSFEEFFSMQGKAAFQAGTLYIDGRSCRLCMPASSIDSHATLAAKSQLFLLYCACQRGVRPDTGEPAQTMNIVSVVTAGDSDLLIQNRNGVFIDNNGDDWDATVLKIVSNPIDLWQALWSPYKKIGNMITDQIGKYASTRQDVLLSSAGQKIQQIGATMATPRPRAASFDISRNVGMFAAVGIALGALGTALGSIFRALFAMSWWQFPLLLLGLFALVSGPSVLIAWLKLRQRTLGPLLEASGWAVNGQVAINYRVSKRLTGTAVLPENSQRSKNDPLASIIRWRLIALIIGLGIGIFGWFGLRSCQPYIEEILPVEEAPAPTPAPAAPSPAPAPAETPAPAATPAPAPAEPPPAPTATPAPAAPAGSAVAEDAAIAAEAAVTAAATTAAVQAAAPPAPSPSAEPAAQATPAAPPPLPVTAAPTSPASDSPAPAEPTLAAPASEPSPEPESASPAESPSAPPAAPAEAPAPATEPPPAEPASPPPAEASAEPADTQAAAEPSPEPQPEPEPEPPPQPEAAPEPEPAPTESAE